MSQESARHAGLSFRFGSMKGGSVRPYCSMCRPTEQGSSAWRLAKQHHNEEASSAVVGFIGQIQSSVTVSRDAFLKLGFVQKSSDPCCSSSLRAYWSNPMCGAPVLNGNLTWTIITMINGFQTCNDRRNNVWDIKAV